MQFSDTTFGAVKNGVLVVSGYVIRVTVEMGMLAVRDGIKGAEIERRFPRAGCPVSRLIAVRPEGIISFAALRWLHNVGASFVQLDYEGTPITVTVPRVTVPAALRRTQALATVETRLGKAIAGSLIKAKIAEQIATLRTYDRHAAADEIGAIAERLHARADTLALLGAEGLASAVYWGALADVPLSFGKRQAVPAHWSTFSVRRSSITGDPRGATVPAQAALNYCGTIALGPRRAPYMSLRARTRTRRPRKRLTPAQRPAARPVTRCRGRSCPDKPRQTGRRATGSRPSQYHCSATANPSISAGFTAIHATTQTASLDDHWPSEFIYCVQ